MGRARRVRGENSTAAVDYARYPKTGPRSKVNFPVPSRKGERAGVKKLAETAGAEKEVLGLDDVHGDEEAVRNEWAARGDGDGQHAGGGRAGGERDNSGNVQRMKRVLRPIAPRVKKRGLRLGGRVWVRGASPGNALTGDSRKRPDRSRRIAPRWVAASHGVALRSGRDARLGRGTTLGGGPRSGGRLILKAGASGTRTRKQDRDGCKQGLVAGARRRDLTGARSGQGRGRGGPVREVQAVAGRAVVVRWKPGCEGHPALAAWFLRKGSGGGWARATASAAWTGGEGTIGVAITEPPRAKRRGDGTAAGVGGLSDTHVVVGVFELRAGPVHLNFNKVQKL